MFDLVWKRRPYSSSSSSKSIDLLTSTIHQVFPSPPAAPWLQQRASESCAVGDESYLWKAIVLSLSQKRDVSISSQFSPLNRDESLLITPINLLIIWPLCTAEIHSAFIQGRLGLPFFIAVSFMRFMSVFFSLFDGGEEPISGPFSLDSRHRGGTFLTAFATLREAFLILNEEDKSITSPATRYTVVLSLSFCDTDNKK